MKKIQRIKELVTLLNYYRDKYYNNQDSEISDFEYDQLYDELFELESETGFIMATSPTQTVGYEVRSELAKVKHNHPMLSLDKTKDINDVVKFLDDREGVVMAKMDGLTCSLRYVDGELISAETRGDGETGEDILHSAKTIKNIPLHINCKEEVIIDGEVIIPYNDFEKINATLPEDEKYKHPRNLASGSIRQLDSSVAAQRNMQFVAWKLIKGFDSNSFWDRISFMKSLGFTTVIASLIPSLQTFSNTHGGTDDYSYMIEGLTDKIKDISQEAGYPIDGCVFGYEDVAYGDSLGATGHHLRSQIAYKFYDELYETKLLDIEWTMGKTNTLTPTAIFETVNIDGTDISKASLHNISIIKKLGLTNNCTVRVYKANQIIPQIDSCLQDGDSAIEIPKLCPACGVATDIVKENESEVLMCQNPYCSGKLLGKFKFFVSKPAINIEGLSEKALEVAINAGWLADFKDIYNLYKSRDWWITFPGFGERSVDKILEAIEKSRNTTLDRFICALSIDGIGKSAAKTISEYFNGDFYAFLEAFDNNFDWTILTDVGDKTAQNINEYLAENEEEVCELAKEFNFILPKKVEVKENPLNGIKFCITGSFSQSRDNLKEQLEVRGAKFVSSVSKNLDILFCGEKAGSKLTKAQSLGVKVVYEDELIKMLED